MKMSKFFDDKNLKDDQEFICMELFMRKDGNNPFVFRLYVHVRGDTLLGDYRKVVNKWMKNNSKTYERVPFEGVYYSCSNWHPNLDSYVSPEKTKIPHEILTAIL